MTSEIESRTEKDSTMVAFGQVVNVKPIPTRQVTQIVIEIPDNHHIAATTMLFGKNAFVLAASPKARASYGVVPLEMMDEGPAPAQEPESHARAIRSKGLTISVNPTQWLGIHCQEAMFMDWIGARSAQEAAEKVRNLCGVESRAHIATSPQAMDLFVHRVYQPYRAHEAAQHRDYRETMTAGR